jgi:tetratricopeptide (TPR) repeat protein
MLLADIYYAKGDTDAAETHLRNAIDAISAESDGGSTESIRLFRPLVALGDFYATEGDHEFALAEYARARNIGRRDSGFQTQSEIEIIDRMTHSNLALGRIDIARNLQRDAVEVIQLGLGATSAEAVQALFHYARWLREHFEPAGLTLQEVTDIYTDAWTIIYQHLVSGDSRQAAHALEMYARERLDGNMGWGWIDGLRPVLKALADAEQIYREHALDDPLLEARIALDRGDWYLLLEAVPQLTPREAELRRSTAELLSLSPNDARGSSVAPDTLSFYPEVAGITKGIHLVSKYYLEAWDTLGRLPNGDELRDEWFNGVTWVAQAPLQSRLLSADSKAPLGYIELGFRIDKQGRARKVNVLQSEPAGLIDKAARKRLGDSRFRPRIVDGKIVESDAVVSFRYQYVAE